MSAEMKYWVWIAVCLVAISGANGHERNSAFVRDGAVNEDVMSYWETRMHGVRMPLCLRALVSPLTAREAAQFLVDIRASGGHYLPTHATTFCKAALIRCAQVGREPTEQAQKSLPSRFHDGKEPEEHSQETRPLKDPPIFYFNYPFTNNEEAPKERSPLKDPIFYFNYPFTNNEEEYTKVHSQKTRPLKEPPVFYFNYPFTNNEENTKVHSQKTRPLKDPPIFYFNYPFTNNAEDPKVHSQQNSQKIRLLRNPIFYYNYPFTNNEEEPKEHSQKIRRFLSGAFGKGSEASSQAKPTLKTYENEHMNVGKVRGISTYYFREKQVLVSGVDIKYVNFTSFTGDAEDDKVDRTFLPRKLAKLFPLGGDGAEIASMLGVSDKNLQESLGLCAKAMEHGMNAEVGMCLASIEDVVDFTLSVLGASPAAIDIYAAVSNAGHAKLGKAGNAFHVLNVKKLKADIDEPHVSCHDMAFPFRVFFCHYPKQTMLFQVTLQGEDDSTHDRIAICHYDTSSWNPLHVSFGELHTKPGESEACHWLAGSMWSGNSGWVFVRGAAVV